MFEKLEKFQLVILSIIIMCGFIIAANIITGAINKNSITVTGSYSQNVTSDTGRIEFELVSRQESKAKAFEVINKQRPDVIKYLEEKGFKPEEITLKTPNGYNTYKMLPNGSSTNEIAFYNVSQSISVKSNDVNKIKETAAALPELIGRGIDINVYL